MGFGAGDTNLYRYVGNSSTNWTDPTGEYAQVGALAAGGAIFGGLGALFNDIETGQFGWNTIGNVVKGAAVGAVFGAAIGLGVGALAAGATTAFGTAAAGTAVETTAAFGFAAKSAYDAGGNFGEGRYLSGALDLVGVGLGAFQTAKGITRDIPGIIKQEAAARAQAKIDTLHRVEAGLNDLTRQTQALSDIIKNGDNNGAVHLQQVIEAEGISSDFRPVMSQSRNTEALTQNQQKEVMAYAKKLGATDEMIRVSNNMNTAYGNMFGQEILYIETDVLPLPNFPKSGVTANSRLSPKSVIAHELIGHRRSEQAGRAFDRKADNLSDINIAFDEAQASIRAARFAPDLSSTERYTLLRDGINRLKSKNMTIKDVRHLLWIEEP
jgi:hypothetical protein